MDDTFAAAMRAAYDFPGIESLILGAPRLGTETLTGAPVRIPLPMMNRHGLIAGATGTGKTRTLQMLADQLSAAGVAVFLADMKGDLTGMVEPGVMNEKIGERANAVGHPFVGRGAPAEFLSLTGKQGIPVRATVSSFGPLLLSRVLDLNETQQSVLSMVFKYCDDRRLLLLDLADLKAVLLHLTGEGAGDLHDYGNLSKSTVGVLLRNLVELEQQGGEQFFGEPEWDIDDLLAVDGEGRGRVSILELGDIQDHPALFSTFMVWLLAALFRELAEAGDLPKPKLVFFFDEAHHLFDGTGKAFQDEIERVVRLIRSKGVGVWFVTQSPRDLTADVLAQLGNRVQHALRAFTPDDEKALKVAAKTMPRSEFYDVATELTALGIGEALVTVLDPNGVPTPVARTFLAPPTSRIEPISSGELAQRVNSSPLMATYGREIDRESAREVLQGRVAEGTPAEREPAPRERSHRPEPSAAEEILKSPVARAATQELVRGIFGLLGMSTSRRRRR